MNFNFRINDDMETFQIEEGLSITFGALSIKDSHLIQPGKKDEIVLHGIKKINNLDIDISALFVLENGPAPVRVFLENMISSWPEEVKTNIVKLILGKSLLLSLKNLDKQKPKQEDLQYAKELKTQAALLKSKVNEVMKHGR